MGKDEDFGNAPNLPFLADEFAAFAAFALRNEARLRPEEEPRSQLPSRHIRDTILNSRNNNFHVAKRWGFLMIQAVVTKRETKLKRHQRHQRHQPRLGIRKHQHSFLQPSPPISLHSVVNSESFMITMPISREQVEQVTIRAIVA
jgi:hypothetical protein